MRNIDYLEIKYQPLHSKTTPHFLNTYQQTTKSAQHTNKLKYTVHLDKDITIHPSTPPKSNVKHKQVLADSITPQVSLINVLITAIHEHHLVYYFNGGQNIKHANRLPKRVLICLIKFYVPTHRQTILCENTYRKN